jgi:hypothetical protein
VAFGVYLSGGLEQHSRVFDEVIHRVRPPLPCSSRALPPQGYIHRVTQ